MLRYLLLALLCLFMTGCPDGSVLGTGIKFGPYHVDRNEFDYMYCDVVTSFGGTIGVLLKKGDYHMPLPEKGQYVFGLPGYYFVGGEFV